jgi:RHS repeat-associated protein
MPDQTKNAAEAADDQSAAIRFRKWLQLRAAYAVALRASRPCFTYGAAGNMITNGSTSYIYDAENRLIWTSGYLYVYDGDGDRVEKCVAATSTTPCPTSGTNGTLYWRGRGSDTLDETDLSGNVVEEYIYFDGQRVARREVSGSGGTIAVHYYFSDHLGSHGVVENATASACEQDVDYYPYGGEENDYCSTQVAQHYKFTGKERDTESGLDNFGARYEASNLGRFMTPDWAAKPATVPYAKFGDPQTLNLYAYTENGPVNKADADGHKFGVPVGVDSLISDMSLFQGWSQSFNPQPYQPYQTTQPAQKGQTGQTAQNKQPPPPPPPAQPKKGFAILPTVVGSAEVGVGKAGATIQGSGAVSAPLPFVDSNGHPSLGAVASGSEVAYAGQHTAGKPKQDSDSFVAGAFAGVGGGVTLTNAGNAPAMKTMTNTLNIDIGLGPAASISISSGHSGISSVTITLGFGFGLAATETNTATVTAPQ